MSTNTEHAARMSMVDRIRLAMAEARLGQTELAKLSGVPQPNISTYLRGKANLTNATYDRLMDAIVTHMGRTPAALDAIDGTLGIVGRSQGKLGLVTDLMGEPEPINWVVEGFLAKQHVTIIAGQEGSGKSMLSQTIAKALANGEREAFGFRLPGRHLRGLVVDVENVIMPTDDVVKGDLVKRRLQDYGLTVEGSEYLAIAGSFGFDLDKDSDTLDAILADATTSGFPFEYVVLDSFRSLWTSGSENTGEAGRVLSKLNRLAYKHNCAFLLLHHTNKAGAAYSGHTSIGSTVAAVWTFSKLVHKSEETGKKEQHPTARFLSPYKMRLMAEIRSRIVSTSSTGITSAKSADDYAAEGFDIDPGTEDTETD